MTSQGPDDLRAVHAARRELGPDYDDALLETFVDRAEAQLRHRMAASEASAGRSVVPTGSDRFQVTIGFNGIALIAGNIGWGLLSTLAANTTSNGYGYPPLGVLIIWVLLGLADTAYIGTLIGRRAGRQRPPGTGDSQPIPTRPATDPHN